MGERALWRQADFESMALSGSAPWDWAKHAYDELARRLADPVEAHPCYFGVASHRAGANSFAVVDRRVPGLDVAALAGALREFRDRAWQGPKHQSLIVFDGPPQAGAPLSAHRDRFWEILSELSRHDESPWPAAVPRDTADARWQWSFAGEPWFVFGGSPAFRRRRSRNLGPSLVLVFQTRRVFEGLAGTSAAGMLAKRRIRASLAAYDALSAHPALGPDDASSQHKWRQYFLSDDDTNRDPDSCPFGAAPAAGGGQAQ